MIFDKFSRLIEYGDEILYPFILNGEPKLGHAKVISSHESLKFKDLNFGLFYNNINPIGKIPETQFFNIAIIKKWYE
jgi:hypothetical protein